MNEMFMMPQLYRACSPIHGVGLFTHVGLAVGSDVLVITGKLVSTDELSDKFIRQGLIQGVHPGLALVSADGSRSDFSYMNHSDDCNCRVDLQRMAVIAIREINAGDELTLDYRKEPFDARVRAIVDETLGRRPPSDKGNLCWSI